MVYKLYTYDEEVFRTVVLFHYCEIVVLSHISVSVKIIIRKKDTPLIRILCGQYFVFLYLGRNTL